MNVPTDAMIGFAVVAVLLVGYVVLLRVLLEIAQPARERLFAVGESILEDRKLTDRQRKHIEMLLYDAFSTRIAILFAVGFLAVLVDEILGRSVDDDPMGNLRENAQVQEARQLFVASLAASNPLIVLTWIPLALLIAFVRKLRGHSAKPSDLVQEPVWMTVHA